MTIHIWRWIIYVQMEMEAFWHLMWPHLINHCGIRSLKILLEEGMQRRVAEVYVRIDHRARWIAMYIVAMSLVSHSLLNTWCVVHSHWLILFQHRSFQHGDMHRTNSPTSVLNMRLDGLIHASKSTIDVFRCWFKLHSFLSWPTDNWRWQHT